MEITVNGESKSVAQGLTAAALLQSLGLSPDKVALERNREIVPRSRYGEQPILAGDALEIVHFIGGGDVAKVDDDPLVIAGRSYRSRLIVGTGKYKDFEETKAAVEASGAEIVTVAVRRVNIAEPGQPMLVDYLDPEVYTYLPNTAGCFTGDDAVRTLRLAREAGGWSLVKLEVLGDKKTLYPNMVETLKAAEALTADGFEVMVYTNDDPIQCAELEDMGCVAIMPLGAPIGSGLGIQNPVQIRLIVEQAKVPVLVDAGVGTA
ncbi:MAG: sulfur carrier protein ThiS, partial [Sphingomonadales bacterium]|nr:sulfur carrier protein ThiS [Sphingomonadales bacterium]